MNPDLPAKAFAASCKSTLEIEITWPNGQHSTIQAFQPEPPAVRGWAHNGFTGTSFTCCAAEDWTILWFQGNTVIKFRDYIPVFRKCMLHPTTSAYMRPGWD